jgi:hypothetical protein
MAALLVCATMAGATRADALLAAGGSAMDCCKGGVMKDSCPVMRLKGVRRAELIRAEPKPSDPICHARASLSVRGRTARAAAQDVSSPGASAKVAPSYVAHAKLSPTDCSCRADSLTRTPRPRDEAALPNKTNPRPPTPAAARRLARPGTVARDEARRQSPPRAPPASL